MQCPYCLRNLNEGSHDDLCPEMNQNWQAWFDGYCEFTHECVDECGTTFGLGYQTAQVEARRLMQEWIDLGCTVANLYPELYEYPLPKEHLQDFMGRVFGKKRDWSQWGESILAKAIPIWRSIQTMKDYHTIFTGMSSHG